MGNGHFGPQNVGGGFGSSGPSGFDLGPLFETRAKISKKELTEERKMFLRFDAWSDPRLLHWLNTQGEKLSKPAQNLFIEGKPEIKESVLRCGFDLLTSVPGERARMLRNDSDYGIPLRVSGNGLLKLADTGLSVPGLIREIADYQHRIFGSHFPAQGLPSPDLDLAFARFASGKLRLAHGPQEWMNAEPDSAYFFAFAEFCIQAAHVSARPGHDWWLSLGCLFAALQDVYCQRYHNGNGPRRFDQYADTWFDDRHVIDDDLMLRMVQSVRRRDRTLHDLVDRVTWNAYWYFFDEVAPLKELKPPQP